MCDERGKSTGMPCFHKTETLCGFVLPMQFFHPIIAKIYNVVLCSLSRVLFIFTSNNKGWKGLAVVFIQA
jgi:hypothetical protein